MRAYELIWVAAWLLSPVAFVNVGFGLAIALLQLVFWYRGTRGHGALLLRLGRRMGTDRLVDLGAAAVAIGAIIEVAALALATPVTVWGVRVGVALGVVGLAVVGSALRPVELRANGAVIRGQLVRWAQLTGHAWSADTPPHLELTYVTIVGVPRRVLVEVAAELRPQVERLLRERVSADRALAQWL